MTPARGGALISASLVLRPCSASCAECLEACLGGDDALATRRDSFFSSSRLPLALLVLLHRLLPVPPSRTSYTQWASSRTSTPTRTCLPLSRPVRRRSRRRVRLLQAEDRVSSARTSIVPTRRRSSPQLTTSRAGSLVANAATRAIFRPTIAFRSEFDVLHALPVHRLSPRDRHDTLAGARNKLEAAQHAESQADAVSSLGRSLIPG